METELQIINLGDAQPSPCPICKEKHGYQVTDQLEVHHTLCYTSNGKFYGGFNSDHHTVKHKSIKASCIKCGAYLSFVVNR